MLLLLKEGAIWDQIDGNRKWKLINFRATCKFWQRSKRARAHISLKYARARTFLWEGALWDKSHENRKLKLSNFRATCKFWERSKRARRHRSLKYARAHMKEEKKHQNSGHSAMPTGRVCTWLGPILSVEWHNCVLSPSLIKHPSFASHVIFKHHYKSTDLSTKSYVFRNKTFINIR